MFVDTFQDGYTSLFCAIVNGLESTIKLLISSGCQVELAGQNGKTAVHIASSNGRHLAIRQIVEAGASVDVKNWVGNSIYL